MSTSSATKEIKKPSKKFFSAASRRSASVRRLAPATPRLRPVCRRRQAQEKQKERMDGTKGDADRAFTRRPVDVFFSPVLSLGPFLFFLSLSLSLVSFYAPAMWSTSQDEKDDIHTQKKKERIKRGRQRGSRRQGVMSLAPMAPSVNVVAVRVGPSARDGRRPTPRRPS